MPAQFLLGSQPITKFINFFIAESHETLHIRRTGHAWRPWRQSSSVQCLSKKRVEGGQHECLGNAWRSRKWRVKSSLCQHGRTARGGQKQPSITHSLACPSDSHRAHRLVHDGCKAYAACIRGPSGRRRCVTRVWPAGKLTLHIDSWPARYKHRLGIQPKYGWAVECSSQISDEARIKMYLWQRYHTNLHVY